jgi:lipid kinase YegS
MADSTRIIVNGKVADSPELRASVHRLRGQNHCVDVRVTWEQGDVERFVHEACREGVDTLVVAGGDGSLHEVVNALLRYSRTSDRPRLGIVPMGTANDFAKSCGLPLFIDQALKLAVTGASVSIDVISIDSRYFINVASSGFGAEVTASTPSELKRFLGGASYALMGLILSMNLQPHEGKIILPNSEIREGSILVGAVGNGRQAGGGINLTSRAYLNDGLLDLFFVRQFPLKELGTVIQELSVLPEDGQYIGYIQAPWVEFDHLHPINVNLDGESYTIKKGRAEVVPAALQVVLPTDCPLLVRNRPFDIT